MIPQINTQDFKYWCLIHKKIPDINKAPFDVWHACINEYCELYYRDDYTKTLVKLVGNKGEIK